MSYKDLRINTEGYFETLVDLDTTVWGIVTNDIILNEYSNDFIDYGLDRLSDSKERDFFNRFLTDIHQICNADIYNQIEEDPSNDNFHFYVGQDYDSIQLNIIDRYKSYNNMNSNSTGDSWELYSKRPDSEDINSNNKLETENNYVEYKVSIRNSDFVVGQNNIVEKRFGYNVDLANGEQDVEIAWYHFKIPINEYSNSYGFAPFDGTANSIRIYLTNFEEEVILRFATLNLVGYVE
jgi:cell surface protein SprA